MIQFHVRRHIQKPRGLRRAVSRLLRFDKHPLTFQRFRIRTFNEASYCCKNQSTPSALTGDLSYSRIFGLDLVVLNASPQPLYERIVISVHAESNPFLFEFSSELTNSKLHPLIGVMQVASEAIPRMATCLMLPSIVFSLLCPNFLYLRLSIR